MDKQKQKLQSHKLGFILVLVMAGFFMVVPEVAASPKCNDGIDNNNNGFTDGQENNGMSVHPPDDECLRNAGTVQQPSWVLCPLWTSETIPIDQNPPPNYGVYGC